MTVASDQFKAELPSQLGTPIPVPYQNNTPALPTPSLTAYQLALADQMVKGTTPPFGVNTDFLSALNTYASSKILSPATVNPKTGQKVQPPIAPGVVGSFYIMSGQIIYLIRQAQDCGPDETNRYEKIAVDTTSNLAIRTWQYYGDPQPSGSVADGSGPLGPI